MKMGTIVLKERTLQYLLVCAFFLLPAVAESASIYNPSLVIYPEPAITMLDPVSAVQADRNCINIREKLEEEDENDM